MATLPQPDNDATRARLITAAGEVFAEHGFQSATVRDICTRAGANIAAINYYFRDKAGLYLAVLRHSMTEGTGQPEPRDAALLADTPEQALRLMIAAMLLRMHNPSTGRACHLRIMVHEMAQPTDALPRVVEEIIGPNYAAMRQILSRLLDRPPDDDHNRLCAHSIIAGVVHYACTPARSSTCSDRSKDDARAPQRHRRAHQRLLPERHPPLQRNQGNDFT